MSDYWKQYEGNTVSLKELLKWLSDEHTHVTDGEGELLNGWDFPVVNSMALHRWAVVQAEPVEYEYAVVSDRWLETGWRPDDEDDWTTMGEATDQLIHFDTWYPGHTHRIVKRRKAGGMEEL